MQPKFQVPKSQTTIVVLKDFTHDLLTDTQEVRVVDSDSGNILTTETTRYGFVDGVWGQVGEPQLSFYYYDDRGYTERIEYSDRPTEYFRTLPVDELLGVIETGFTLEVGPSAP